MPVSRLLVRPEVVDESSTLSPFGPLGLASSEPRAATAIETVLGPVGPVRAARWNAQLPASAVAPGELAASGEASAISPKADATSS